MQELTKNYKTLIVLLRTFKHGFMLLQKKIALAYPWVLESLGYIDQATPQMQLQYNNAPPFPSILDDNKTAEETGPAKEVMERLMINYSTASTSNCAYLIK